MRAMAGKAMPCSLVRQCESPKVGWVHHRPQGGAKQSHEQRVRGIRPQGISVQHGLAACNANGVGALLILGGAGGEALCTAPGLRWQTP